MTTIPPGAFPTSGTERAESSVAQTDVVASPGQCPICREPLTGRQRCCSGRCRAALSRRNRIPVKAEDLGEIVASLRRVLEDLSQTVAMVEAALYARGK